MNSSRRARAEADVNLDTSFGSRLELRQILLGAAGRKAPASREDRLSVDAAAYDDVFRRVMRSAEEAQKRLHRERKAATEQWSTLEGHPQERRRMMIRNDRRFQSWGLYQCLVERSRSLADQQPAEAGASAELALEIAQSLDPAEHGEERIADFRAAALAAFAEARRRLADFAGARRALEQARESLEEGTGDPLEEAELEHLWGKLHEDLDDAEEAGRAFRRASALYRRIGDPRLQTDSPAGDPGHGQAPRRHAGASRV